MAFSPSDIQKKYPLPAYNYRVHINDGAKDIAVGFSEVSGLSITYQTTTYAESTDNGPMWMYMPAQSSAPTITMKKGVVKTESVGSLYNWISSTRINQVQKKDVTIDLLDEKGSPVISWKVWNAFPTKLDAPTFTASSNDAAIESMTLMADQITIEEHPSSS